MPTPKKHVHSLTDVTAALNAKIDSLEDLRKLVQARVADGFELAANLPALNQINTSLAHARDAKAALNESCCNQGCNIDWQDL